MAYKHFILVCGGTGCVSSRADEIYHELIANAEAMGVKNDVQVVKTGCFGFCEKGPIVKVLPSESFYVEVKPSDAKEIISEQIVKGREVTRLLYKDVRQKDRIKLEDIQFYQKQYRIVLRNCGIINPENIDASAAAVAQDFRPGASGTFPRAPSPTRSMLSAMPTKAILAPTWTDPR
jgi:(2Fe-2S) ferredoxin